MNPISQMLKGKTASQNPINGSMDIIKFVIKAKKDPEGTFKEMMDTNPEFVKFLNNNLDKTPEQIARENNISQSLLQQYIR